MTREQALATLKKNPTATFNAALAAKMIDAISRVKLNAPALQLWLQRIDGDCVTAGRIRQMAKRTASKLPASIVGC